MKKWTQFALSLVIIFSASSFAGGKKSSQKQNAPAQTQPQVTHQSLALVDIYDVRLEEIDSVAADCNETLIKSALNGDRDAFLPVLATMILSPLFMQETSLAMTKASQMRQKIANEVNIDYADWETIKNYFDLYRQEKKNQDAYIQIYRLRSDCSRLVYQYPKIMQLIDISAQSLDRQMDLKQTELLNR